MARNEITSQIIDDIIRLGSFTLVAGATFVAPNIIIALDKPLGRLFKHLDTREQEREKQREVRRIISYMKSLGYLTGDYEHGLKVTDRAKRRLEKRDIETLQATPPEAWDHTWRIIIYDIPQNKEVARRELQRRLRLYGCFELQRSVLICPLPCFDDITTLATRYDVAQYVTYFESQTLANDKPLIKRFAAKYPQTSFK